MSARFTRRPRAAASAGFFGIDSEIASRLGIILAFILISLSAHAGDIVIQSGTFVNRSVEPARVQLNLGQPPVDTLIQYYNVKVGKRVYKLLPHGGVWTRRDPLRTTTPDTSVSLRLDIQHSRIYILVYKKNGTNSEYRYDIVAIQDARVDRRRKYDV